MRRWRAALLAALIAGLAAPVASAAPARSPDDEVFYHVFTRSLRDSNGDHIGDLKGIADSLGHIQALGATAVLLTPLYPSFTYHNYFASSFEGVDPAFGTMTDFAALVAAVHARGMKLFLDMEIQYLADDHAWWAAARADPTSPQAEMLAWADRPRGLADDGPFKLRSVENFSGRTFGVTTVNLGAPAVQAYFDRYFAGWVDPDGDGDFRDGVDGFRIDHMMDDLDGRHLQTDLFARFWGPRFARLRKINPAIAIIAEQSDWGDGGDYLRRGGVDYVFAFPLETAIRSFDRDKIAAAIARTAAATPPGKHQLTFVENHDMDRIASDPGMTPARLRTAAALMVLLQGTPIIYCGQEIGMRGRIDPGTTTDAAQIPVREAFRWTATVDGPNAAIWYRRPGLRYWEDRYARDHDGVSVAEQAGTPGSLLETYRALLTLRQGHAVLRQGQQRLVDGPPGVLVVERRLGDARMLIVANLTATPVRYPAPGPDLLGGQDGTVAPWSTALFDAAR